MTESHGGLSGPPMPTAVTDADAIRLGLDADGRVRTVALTTLPDALRDGPTLDRAFREAMARTLAADLPPAPPTTDEHGRVRAARVTAPSHRPLRELVLEALDRPAAGRVAAPLSSPVGQVGGQVGESDNGCVRVVLDPAGPGGDLAFDPGWLSQAMPANLAAAIGEAFADAYTAAARAAGGAR